MAILAVMTDNSYSAIIERHYNEAYDHWVHCPDSQKEEAEKNLNFWRKLWLEA